MIESYVFRSAGPRAELGEAEFNAFSSHVVNRLGWLQHADKLLIFSTDPQGGRTYSLNLDAAWLIDAMGEGNRSRTVSKDAGTFSLIGGGSYKELGPCSYAIDTITQLYVDGMDIPVANASGLTIFLEMKIGDPILHTHTRGVRSSLKGTEFWASIQVGPNSLPDFFEFANESLPARQITGIFESRFNQANWYCYSDTLNRPSLSAVQELK